MLFLSLLCLFMAFPAGALLLSLDNSIPFVTSDQVVVNWASGGAAELLARGTGVRLSYRGIRVGNMGRDNSLRPIPGWAAYSCNISRSGLCESDFGRAFAFGDVLRTTDMFTSKSKSWAGDQCSRMDRRVVSNLPWYDLGSCNILDAENEFVFSEGMLYRKQLSWWWGSYWTCVICCVFVARGLSKNIRAAMTGARDYSQDSTLIATIICVLAILVEGDSMYVYYTDYLFYVVNICYALVYIVFHVYHRMRSADAYPIYNMAAGVLQLFACRMFSGAETPYAGVIIFIVACRVFGKMFTPVLPNVLTALADSIFLSLVCDVGFSYDPLYLFPIFMSAYAAATMLWRR